MSRSIDDLTDEVKPLAIKTVSINKGKIWQTYGAASAEAGLNWSGKWVHFKEYIHSQLGDGSNPLKTHSPGRLRVC